MSMSNIYIYMHMHLYTHMYAHTYVYIYIYTYINVYTYTTSILPITVGAVQLPTDCLGFVPVFLQVEHSGRTLYAGMPNFGRHMSAFEASLLAALRRCWAPTTTSARDQHVRIVPTILRVAFFILSRDPSF